MIDENDDYYLFNFNDESNSDTGDTNNYDNKTQREIEGMFNKCNDGELYTLIKSRYKYDYLGNLRIRYLNYYYDNQRRTYSYNDKIEITLSHSEDLVSASLRCVKIRNLSNNVNLKNIFSEWNTCTKQGIDSLHNLKRIHSYSDRYCVATRVSYTTSSRNKAGIRLCL